MIPASKLTTGQRYIFVESLNNFFMNVWHELWKSPGDLRAENRNVVWILAELRSESVVDLKSLETVH